MQTVRETRGGRSLRMLELELSEVSQHGDTIDRILRGDVFGVVVRGAFDPAQLSEVVRRFEAGAVTAPRFEAHTFRGRTYGRVLRMSGESLDEYFDAAAAIKAALEGAFAGGPTYESRLREILTAIGGGRGVSVPIGSRPYAPATVRVIDPGGRVELHCGNETHRFPPLRELVEIIDPQGEISTLVPLARPEAGGVLEIYDVCFGDPRIDELDRTLGREAAHTGMRELLRLSLAPRVGDLALFEEGLHYHRVSDVEGASARWTMGGFVAPSRDGRSLHYWS